MDVCVADSAAAVAAVAAAALGACAAALATGAAAGMPESWAARAARAWAWISVLRAKLGMEEEVGVGARGAMVGLVLLLLLCCRAAGTAGVVLRAEAW